ncbi:TIGR01620 family protein [Allorhizobium sp. BGMRC 0089]|uniref:YcjF family protein n=1 Tax=Allorhizobium sonneratiae TaxID=2934936 RepID=UPI002033AD24|nr:TIGR01620 family protein [Allorhizobium sonneratiae]MCM2292233.1 TIGR01620 family protein [Allorhizobium sonneratiae]
MSPSPHDPNRPTTQAPRRPAVFALDEEEAKPTDEAVRAKMRRPPQSFTADVTLTPDEEDPFIGGIDEEETLVPVIIPAKRRFSFGKLAASAFGALISMAFGLWLDKVIRDLFSESDWLGYTALGLLSIGLLALLIVIIREMRGIYRLNAVQSIKERAVQLSAQGTGEQARKLAVEVQALTAHRAETERGRHVLTAAAEDIIDAPHLIALTEREVLGPLDAKARRLIATSAKRVSVVTAVSPRAVVDLAYVLYEVVRLVRAMAELYGGRPGSLGMIRLVKDVFAHLAVTGSIAVGDSLAQQVLGHGLASRLSARLGEGVINGLMTARIGIAAMDLCRPLPFNSLSRPGIGDFLGDLRPKGED